MYGQMCADLEEKRYVDYIVAQIFVFVKVHITFWRSKRDSNLSKNGILTILIYLNYMETQWTPAP